MNTELKILLSQLNRKQKTVFAALICEKMYPLYQKFSALTGWGDANVFQEGIVVLYEFVLDGLDVATSRHIEKIEYIMPDLDNFEGTAAAYALDACLALVESLTFLFDFDDEHIINCSTSATDTIDMHVQLVEELDSQDPSFERKIMSSLLMKNEINRQKKILTSLSTVTQFSQQEITRLRNLNGVDTIVDLSVIV